WNQLHGQRADTQVLRQLVLALRIWRPDVVITDNPDARATGSAVEAIVAEALHAAFTQAADRKAFPEQIEQLGLEPWRVSKLYARWAGRSSAAVEIDLTVPRPGLENTARGYVTEALGLLTEKDDTLPAKRYYHLLDSRPADGAGHRYLMDGTQ